MCGVAARAKFGTGHLAAGEEPREGPWCPSSASGSVGDLGPGQPPCLTFLTLKWAPLSQDLVKKKMLLVKYPEERPTHLWCSRDIHCYTSKLLSGSHLSCPIVRCCYFSYLCPFLVREDRNPILELYCLKLGSADFSVKDNGECVSLCGPNGSRHSAAEQPRLYVQECMWLCTNKTLSEKQVGGQTGPTSHSSPAALLKEVFLSTEQLLWKS